MHTIIIIAMMAISTGIMIGTGSASNATVHQICAVGLCAGVAVGLLIGSLL